MADERNETDQNELPDLHENEAVSASPSTPESTDYADGDRSDSSDEIPVPIAMSAAEIDERAQAVEALRGSRSTLGSRDEELRSDA